MEGNLHDAASGARGVVLAGIPVLAVANRHCRLAPAGSARAMPRRARGLRGLRRPAPAAAPEAVCLPARGPLAPPAGLAACPRPRACLGACRALCLVPAPSSPPSLGCAATIRACILFFRSLRHPPRAYSTPLDNPRNLRAYEHENGCLQ